MPEVSEPSALPNAGVWRRLAALAYDGFLLFAILFAATALYQWGLHWIHPAPPPPELATGDVVNELPVDAHGLLYQLYLLAVIAVFYGYFWRRNGQTLGMQAWRLRLDSAAGGRATLKQCLLRILASMPALLLAGAGYWWIWLDRDGLAWQDRFSGTRVVVLPKNN